MINKLEKHGGICDSQASRDTFIYAASAYTTGINLYIYFFYKKKNATTGNKSL